MNDLVVGRGNIETAPDSNPLDPPRLNLFAFPSLTTLLFALIAGVILVAVGSGLRQNPSALGVMILLGMILLPMRSFLWQVEHDLSAIGLGQGKNGSPPPELAAQVKEAAEALKVHLPPRLLVAPHAREPFTIGSWRRRYVAIGQPQVDCLARLPEATRRTLWLHEVAHFANGDHWKVGLSRSLLRTTIGFMSWSALFLLGVGIIAFVYGLELFEPGFLDTVAMDPSMREILAPLWPDPALTVPLLAKARNIHPGLASLYVLNSFLPFIFSGLLLLPFVWRWLVQVREFYADARVAAQVGDCETARRTLVDVGNELALGASERPRGFRGRVANLRRRLAEFWRFHPRWQQRFACLWDPSKVFGSWSWVGLIAGLVVLLLDLILVGPFTLGYSSRGPVHFVTLSGFAILGVWLVPGVCRGFASTGTLIRQVAGATLLLVALRAGWLLLNTILVLALLVVDQELLQSALNATIYLGAKALTGSAALRLPYDAATLAARAVAGAWGFTLLAGTSLFCFLSLTGLVLRQLLTWYSFPHVERHLLWVGWAALLVLALVLGAIILPPPTALIQGDFASFLQPIPLGLMGIAGLCATAGGFWFLYHDRRYSRRCPTCNGHVPGWFELGKRCPTCEQVLHPWLLAGY